MLLPSLFYFDWYWCGKFFFLDLLVFYGSLLKTDFSFFINLKWDNFIEYFFFFSSISFFIQFTYLHETFRVVNRETRKSCSCNWCTYVLQALNAVFTTVVCLTDFVLTPNLSCAYFLISAFYHSQDNNNPFVENILLTNQYCKPLRKRNWFKAQPATGANNLLRRKKHRFVEDSLSALESRTASEKST